MAMPVQPLLIGVDVAKAELVISQAWQEQLVTLPNTRSEIKRYLKGLPGPVCLSVEATNTYHLELIEQAHAQGHTVYLIDGYRLERYRQSIGARAKTDAADARLLRRYLEREQDQLRRYSPPPKGYMSLVRLLRRRAKLVQARTALAQSFKELPELKASAAALLRQLDRLDALIQKRIAQALRAQGWEADAARCQALEGIGPLISAALAVTFRRGAFKNADAFIAFLGLDVRVRESGTFRGRRKLTKKGDPELRRLLYMAAMQASRSSTWQPFYQRHLERGMSKVQALVVLARKLARLAFALMKNQSEYQPKLPVSA
jgi:transposase